MVVVRAAPRTHGVRTRAKKVCRPLPLPLLLLLLLLPLLLPTNN